MASLALALLASTLGAAPTATWQLEPTQQLTEYDFFRPNFETHEVGELEVRTDGHLLFSRAGAYAFARMRLWNRAGAPRPLQASMVLGRNGGELASASWALGPNERRVVYLPALGDAYGGQLTLSTPGALPAVRYQGRFEVSMLVVGPEAAFSELVHSEPAPAGTPTHLRGRNVMAMDAAELPLQLPVLLSFPQIVLLAPGFSELPEPQRAALELYASAGGRLVLAHPTPADRPLLPLLSSDEEGPYGTGELVLCGTAAQCAREVRAGHGLRQLVTSIPQTQLLPQAKVPVVRFLLLIFAFALVVGPGSWVLARRHGPGVMLLSIPGTALVACLAMMGHSFLFEGFSTHVTSRGVTWLDERSGRAVTVALIASYANLGSNGLALDWDTVLEPPRGEVALGVGAQQEVDGLVPARTYREWGVTIARQSRARLAVRSDGGGLRVQNALGAPVTKLYLRRGGELYVAGRVADGGEAPLTLATGDVELWDESKSDERFTREVLHPFVSRLQDGEYWAELERPIELPVDGMLQPVWHEPWHAVRGRMAAR